ncbi:hypothetical protein ABK040_007625 [Willaertia magna]
MFFKNKFRGSFTILCFAFILLGLYYYFLHPYLPKEEKALTPTTEVPEVKKEEKVLEQLNHENDGQEEISNPLYVIPVIIFTYKRAKYLRKTLNTVFKYLPSNKYKVFVSQDGFDAAVKRVVDSFGSKIAKHFQRERIIKIPDNPVVRIPEYYSIAQHYKFGIDNVFSTDPTFDRIIILEEDLEIAPDFFDYFNRMSTLLDKDTTILCISAWNDNGMKGYVSDPTAVYRSDFFPGLGWMIKRKLWEDEIGPKWPIGFWDDWMREGENRKGRVCIRPEVSRTYTFGVRGGASSNQYSNYLLHIKLNQEKVNWNNFDINSLIKDKYDDQFLTKVKHAPLIKLDNIKSYNYKGVTLRVEYKSNDEYLEVAAKLGIMPDIKDGVPRGAYLGTITIKYRGNTVYLTTPTQSPVTYLNTPPYKQK